MNHITVVDWNWFWLDLLYRIILIHNETWVFFILKFLSLSSVICFPLTVTPVNKMVNLVSQNNKFNLICQSIRKLIASRNRIHVTSPANPTPTPQLPYKIVLQTSWKRLQNADFHRDIAVVLYFFLLYLLVWHDTQFSWVY